MTTKSNKYLKMHLRLSTIREIRMHLIQLNKIGVVTAFTLVCLTGCGAVRKNTEIPQSQQTKLQKDTEGEKSELSEGKESQKQAAPVLTKKDLLERFSKQIPSGNLDRFGRFGDKKIEESRKPVSLSEEQSNRVIVKNKSTLIACYERAMKNGRVSNEKDLHVKFDLTISRKGLVTEVDISGDSVRDKKFRRCLARRVQNWTFPRSRGKSMLSFPFMFARG